MKPEKQSPSFNPTSFEQKWRQYWEKQGVYQPDLKSAKKPYYNLMMFPYPSAEGLHVGNMYAFTGADINGRYQRMKGFDVFEPIGLDGFGIHSENYALKVGRHPKEQAKISAKNYYRQLHAIGNGFAFKNTLETYDPDYYRWTQWIFVQMFKHGLAYRKKSPLNFCPSCKTVLADEQVINGLCERCKSQVEKREMEQWFFKITDYAEKLLQNTFKQSFQWSDKVKIGQRNWIGKKEGIIINYSITQLSNNPITITPNTISCFTTRPDTNFGATFVVLAPEHPFVNVILNLFQDPKKIPDQARLAEATAKRVRNDIKVKEIKDYVERAKSKSEMDRIAEGRKKTGVFTGFYAINQLTNNKMPIYITDFVLGHVGTGAVVGVPGHDLRDFQFAKEFNLPIIRVVVGKDGDKTEITREEQIQEEEGTMINSSFLDGKDIHEATKIIMDYFVEKGCGKRVIEYKLRDWCISRQRYWGAPIPMINCPVCGWQPVPEDQLPVLLPDLEDWKPEGTGKGPLAKLSSFVKTKCPKCGGEAKRETDVCDTFLDSSWYFLRYPSVNIEHKTKNIEQKSDTDTSEVARRDSSDGGGISKQLPWDHEITRRWLPVTQYIGGAEHTVLHLLYARFVTMALKDWRYIDFEEPFSRFYAHGLIIAEGAKMSKSRGNVVIPDVYIAKYGADALRTYLMFLGPFDQGGDFRDTGIAGMYRFLGRVWRLVFSVILIPTASREKNPDRISENAGDPSSFRNTGTPQDDTLRRVMHHTIKEVTEDLENFRYNTAIAHIMEFVNQLTDNLQLITNNHIKSLLLMLAPFAPHMTEELWHKFHLTKLEQLDKLSSIHLHPWPLYDPKYLVEEEVTMVIQVNGKTREIIKIQNSESGIQNKVEEEAKTSEKIKKYLVGMTIRKVIFVPGRLINFVIS
ncbi:leucine--tRNA ligase [Candidatus Microgenomates bacterium]|nr:leucine--tRNA ligase [Candidatus Microgenomates bacterium]